MKAALGLLVAFRLMAQSPCMFQGTVSDSLNGKPLAGVKVFVHAISSGPAAAYLRKSDAAGRFCFERLAPGTYDVIAQRVGYLDQWLGAAPGSQEGVDLTVNADSKLAPAKIEMAPRPILTGTVLDADGQPAAWADVAVWQRTYTANGADQDSVASGQTDGRGMFRFADLPPGTYYVSAEPPMPPHQFSVEFLTDRGKHANEEETTTYFPAAPGLAGARPLVLKAGQEFSGVTILLRRTLLRHLSGRVTGSTANTTIILDPQFEGALYMLIRVRPDGSFERFGLLPGKYALQLIVNPGHGAEQMVDLTDGDAEGINVVARETFAVPLRIQTEGGGPPVRPGQFQMMLFSIPSDRGSLARVTSDGSSEFSDVLPGPYHLVIDMHHEHYYLKRLVMNGKAQAAGHLELSSPPDGPLELTFSPNVAAITGRFSGKPAGAVTVLLVETGTADGRGYEQRASCDQNGEFRLDAVKPGNYRLFAIEGFDENAWGSPQLAAALHSLEVGVGESETKEVTAPLVHSEEWNAAVERLKQ